MTEDNPHIKLLQRGIDVAPIYWRLLEHPELWNQCTARTQDPSSPHHGLDDIWARYGSNDEALRGGPVDIRWQPAADILGIKQICHDVMHMVGGVELGGVLLTRIPPGAMCRPHEDHGWHAHRFDKFLLQIASAPGQAFCFPGVELETRPGDLAWFENQTVHWVQNPTQYERVSMVICIRMEK